MKRYLASNVVGNLVCALIVTLATGIWLFVRGTSVVPRIIFWDDRNVLTVSELRERFSTEGGMSITPDGGFCATGDGVSGHSVATCDTQITGSLSIGSQIKPLRTTPMNNYWRAGFTFRRQNGAEAITVHLDNHHFVVGYLGARLHLCVPLHRTPEGRWTLLKVDLSYTRNSAVSCILPR